MFLSSDTYAKLILPISSRVVSDRLKKGLSCMMGNYHVQFLGENGAQDPDLPGANKLPMNWLIIIFLAFISLIISGCGKTDGWPNLGVLVNKEAIKKELVAECCFRGGVRQIQVGDYLPGEKLEVAVLGQTGILFLDAESLVQLEKNKFVNGSGDTKWFGLEPRLIENNSTGFTIMQGGGGFGETGMLDSEGERIWQFKVSEINPHMMISVDLDGDNKTEFYASDYSGLYRLNSSGKVVWKLSKNITDIAYYESKTDNIRGLVALDTKARLIYLIKSDGSIQGEIKINKDVYHFNSVFLDGETLLVVRDTSKSINVINLQGNIIFSHIFKAASVYHGPISTALKFKDSDEPIIAILMNSRSSIGKSLLSIFSINGSLLYQEVLDGGTGMTENRGKLLVGDGVKHVWAYY